MPFTRYKDFGGDGVDDNGGAPHIIKKKWITVSWDFPTSVTCLGFEVVVFTGTDPTTNIIVGPTTVTDPTSRSLVQPVAPRVSLANINAAVRALYA